MTIQERMVARTEREKDLLKYGRSQERERIIKLLEDDLWHDIRFVTRGSDEEQAKYHDGECLGCHLIALIKGEK